MEQQADFQDYIQAFKRRRLAFIIPFVIVFAISVVVTFLLPSIYKSSAVILIEAQEIPQEMVRSTVTGYIEERLQTISKIVLSRKNLLDIVNKYKLYPDLRQTGTTEDVLDEVRSNISMESIQAEVMNPTSGRSSEATIAFSLSFEGKNPQVVSNVANTLTSLYLEENLKARQEKAGTTYDFLEQQVETLKREMEDTESKVAAFKEKNLHSLPELMEVNLNTLQRLEKDVSDKRTQLINLQDRLVYLQGQLAAISPYQYISTQGSSRMSSPTEELDMLRRQYITLKSRLSDKHPDVIRLQNQLRAMEATYGGRSGLASVSSELDAKRMQLTEAQQKYSDKHPDVIALKKEVHAMEDQLGEFSKYQSYAKQSGSVSNPSYINIQSQVKAAELDIEKTKASIADSEAKMEDYQRRVEETPRVEQEYKSLLRDYDTARAKYAETASRLQVAKEAKGLEEQQMGEQFTVVDSPAIPEKPEKPNRIVLLLIGFVLACGAGVGVGTMAEFMDKSIHNPEEISTLSAVPVLSSVPYLVTLQDLRMRTRKRIAMMSSVAAVLIVMVATVHFAYQPIDILWGIAVQRFQTFF
ncbi:GumC family protein [Desulfovibrio inopinatus]|uniref:GumC family protein n=1 Tax=Desulfovibrio inopinatus TaxID=102109 RepID=UPI000416A53D|nr:Wzz/FepE/Etk N-terminal domain-containing protein [Desulfovibrio inopinatus]